MHFGEAFGVLSSEVGPEVLLLGEAVDVLS
jgi:hypothetical protein